MQSPDLQLRSVNRRGRLLAAGSRFPEHQHSFWEFGWVAGGEAFWHLRGRRPLRLREGEGILIPRRHYHWEEALRPASFAWIGFRAAPAVLAGIPVGRRLGTGAVRADLSSLIDRLIGEERDAPPFHEERIALLLRELLLLLRRAAPGLPRPGPVSPAPPQAAAIEASRAYIERNLREELTIGQVARYHGFSLSHFEVLFAARFGESPKRHQQRCRLRAVQRMMGEGVRSPKLLAAAFGFNDAAYFCRWFKKWTGLPPSRHYDRFGKIGRTDPMLQPAPSAS